MAALNDIGRCLCEFFDQYCSLYTLI